MIQESFQIGPVTLSNESPLTVIAGPCALESREHALEMAHALKEITDKLQMGFIFKTSFDKANRTSSATPRGIGLKQALPIFEEIRLTVGCPVLTDVHTESQCNIIAEVVDVLQIPAFLCRQTDLLIAAANTGRAINVKKGQFLAPWDMKNVIQKIRNSGNNRVLACERGTCFGYNTLITDMRSLPILKEIGCPVVFDATHSVQQPGGLGDKSKGERQYVSLLSRAAVTAGISTVYLETHQDPDNAPSDGPNMVFLKDMPTLLASLQRIDHLIKKELKIN